MLYLSGKRARLKVAFDPQQICYGQNLCDGGSCLGFPIPQRARTKSSERLAIETRRIIGSRHAGSAVFQRVNGAGCVHILFLAR